MAAWTEKDIPDLKGRVAVVTGANSGIGLETALQLAGHGARTVLACRDPAKADAAALRIRQAFPQATVETLPLDLASLASIRAFSQALHGSASRLDVLVNNAGVMALPRRSTADGFEMQFGTNHLGHFALTGLLLDLVLAAPAGRVVTLSSGVHWSGRLSFDDLQGLRRYRPWTAYAQSKLANLSFAFELHRRLKASGAPASSLASHPGYAATNLQAAGPRMNRSLLGELFFKVANVLFAQSAAKGALPSLYAAASPQAHSGDFFGPRILGAWGSPAPARASARARDEADARRLWELSEEMTNVRYQALARAA